MRLDATTPRGVRGWRTADMKNAGPELRRGIAIDLNDELLHLTAAMTESSTTNPTQQPNSPSEETVAELSPYQLFMFALGIFVLISLAVQTFFKLDAATDHILDQADLVVCGIFFIDFWISLWRAPNRWVYLKWGWIDLLSSIPMLDFARAGRLARVIRVLRAFRAVRSARFLTVYMLKHRSDGAFYAVALISLMMLVFSSLAILQVETVPDSNIKTPQDALWWAFTTITTVGYGDRFPVTSEGRLIAAALMTAGVGMFGSCTGLIASWLLVPTKKDREQDTDLARLHVQIAEIQETLKSHFPGSVKPSADLDLQQLLAAWPELSAEAKSKILAALSSAIGD